MDDGYAVARQRAADALDDLQRIGLCLDITAEERCLVDRELAEFEPDDIAAMPNGEFDAMFLLDYDGEHATYQYEGDNESGDLSNTIAGCVRVAGPAFPAEDIEEKGRGGSRFRVRWKIGGRLFELERIDVFAINEGVIGPNRFYDPGWDTMGHLIFLSPEQADMAQKLRGWSLVG